MPHSPELDLPTEIICRILCLLSPQEFVRLRLVSKQFHAITYIPTMWKILYTNAPLPRPPGPFPFQSSRYLEDTLSRSERLAQSWTTQPLQDISSVEILIDQEKSRGHPKLCGKWFISCESSRKFVFHDLDSNTCTPQVLWDDVPSITFWDAHSVVSADGHFVYVVFRIKTDSADEHVFWKLLEFQEMDDSGRLVGPICLDIPTQGFVELGGLSKGQSPFLCILDHNLIFDTHSRTFYKFPAFSSQLDGPQSPEYDSTTREVILANTHILVFVDFYPDNPTKSSSTLIQAFMIPTNPCLADDDVGVLFLSHESFVPSSESLVRRLSRQLIRNSTIDSITGSTDVRILEFITEHNGPCTSCLNLILPKSHSGLVFPITTNMHHIFNLGSELFGPTGSVSRLYVESSEDGHVRGLHRSSPVVKFTIDGTQDKCAALISPPMWNHAPAGGIPLRLFFDGVRGRLCYINLGRDGGVVAVVIDIK